MKTYSLLILSLLMVFILPGCFDILGTIEVDEKGVDLATDEYGNCYVLGLFSGRADLDPGPGTEWRESDGLEDLFLSKFDPNGNLEWVHTWEGHKEYIATYQILVDLDNNVYVCSSFSPGYPAPYSIFLNKFDPSGNLLWEHRWRTRDLLCDIVVTWLGLSAEGHVLMAGLTREDIDLDPFPGSNRFPASENDRWLIEFDMDGAFLGGHVWQLEDTILRLIDQERFLYSIAIDHPSSRYTLAKNDLDGNQLWEYSWGTSYLGEARASIAADNNGDLVLARSFRVSAEYFVESGIERVYGKDDIFLDKFNAEGNLLWSFIIGGNSEDRVSRIVPDNDGSIYITGSFQDSLDFDPGTGTDEQLSTGYLDVFLAKYRNDGSYEWARTWGGDEWDEGVAIALDADGNVFVTGSFHGEVDFDPDLGVQQHESVAGNDIFLSKFDSDGNFLWTRTWGGQNLEYPF